MSAYVVYQEHLPKLLNHWSKEYEIHVPARVEGAFFDFVRWQEGQEIAWDYDLAYNTLKRFFLPPKEDLIEFNLSNYSASPILDTTKRLLFGVHPYDLKGINQLDQLMESGYRDENYMSRRDSTVIFALEPIRVHADAFWESMGAAKVDYGFDLYWTKISPAAFYVQVGSKLGENLLTLNGAMKHEQASLSEREAARRERQRVLTMARQNSLNYDWEKIPSVLDRSYDSSIWKRGARTCLSCGSCVMVCPTCYCFDVQEEPDDVLKTGKRHRQWDGCMLRNFASIAGGHNFRAKAWERYRHRFFRKGKYIYDKIGELGCIGCGRCVSACTAGIANPLAVYNKLWEEVQS